MELIQYKDEIVSKKMAKIIGVVKSALGNNCSIYAYQSDEGIGFIAKNVSKGVIISPKGGLHGFTLGMDGGLRTVIKNCLTLKPAFNIKYQGSEVSIESSYIDGDIEGKITIYRSHDDAIYSQVILFEQYRKLDNKKCIIQYNCNSDGTIITPDMLIKNRLSLIHIDTAAKKRKKFVFPGVIKPSQHIYYKVYIPNYSWNYTLASVNEHGLLKTLKDGAFSLYREPSLTRYTKMAFYNQSKGEFAELPFPFSIYEKEEDVIKYVEENGFALTPPSDYIKMFNGEDEEIRFLSEILPKLHEISKEEGYRYLVR